MDIRKLLTIVTLFTASLSVLGDDYSSIVNGIKQAYIPDRRVDLWEISVNELDSCHVSLVGKTTNAKAKAALLQAFNDAEVAFVDSITVLPDASCENKWALTIIPYAHIRTAPGHEHELSSQALMGNPLKVIEGPVDGFYRIQTPEGYLGWIVGNSLRFMNNLQFDDWRVAERYVVTSIYTYIYSDANCKEIESDLVLGDILCGEKYGKDLVRLHTPDGRNGYAHVSDVELLSKWSEQKFNADKIISTAKALMGSTYTWGGTSTKGVDCSGLTKTAYFSNAIILQRDASQQVLYGKKIDPKDWRKASKADLLYFGTASGRVTHTALYIENGKYIHASGRVKINSVDPNSPLYLTTPFLSINRVKGNIDRKGIVSVKNHPWYFKK
ncbi:MAG: C40 family peptidase [Muribaculaceae bacterium]